MSSTTRISHQDVVRALLDSKAVDFNAIGKVVAELGPTLSLSEEPGDWFCGTNRGFIRLFHVFSPGSPVENLVELGAAGRELNS